MRIFVLEDDPNRMLQIRAHAMPGDEITHITSSTQAGEFKPPYDLVLLDHDLGGRQLEQHEDDGYAFVKAVRSKLKSIMVAVVIYHSYNPGGAQRMWEEAGKKGYIIPFGSASYFSMFEYARELTRIRKKSVQDIIDRTQAAQSEAPAVDTAPLT